MKIEKIASPNSWHNYDGLELTNNFYHNMVNVTRWRFTHQLAQLNQSVDPTRWQNSITLAKVTYQPSNEIEIPAGILQPPFFDPTADRSVNYGAIAALIAHEMSHAFGIYGSAYDPQGRLHNWWTQADVGRYNVLLNTLIRQYDAIVPAGLSAQEHVHGQATAEENQADLNGLSIAIRALKARENNGNIDATLSNDQLQAVFYSWALIWREKVRLPVLREEIASSQYSPASVRVNQVIKNIDDFYRAFDVRPGDKEYLPPYQRVHIW